jgi:formylglycine-generating enzyme required for sulfatase activity
VFKARDENEKDILLYQVIAADTKIAGFIEDPDLKSSNLLTPDELKFTEKPLSIGDSILRAFETTSGDVIFGQTPEFIKKMESSLVTGTSYLYPFVTLEVAQFINHRNLETSCAKNCIISLSRISGALASSWLAKAELSEVARREAEELLKSILKNKSEGGTSEASLLQENHPDFSIFRDRDDNWCPEMIALPAGNFVMGDPTISDRDNPSHAVTLSCRFAIGRYPITFAEFDYFCVMTGYPRPTDRGWGRGRLPVINVTWQGSQAYLTWLSEATRRRYRLPTEAEWEYACRSGTTTAYSWGELISNNYANYDEAGVGRPTAVGQYRENPWGLFDMHGNVYEWCSDGYRNYDTNAALDPIGSRTIGSSRAARGGSWYESALRLRSASRAFFAADSHFVDLGFRCARDLD